MSTKKIKSLQPEAPPELSLSPKHLSGIQVPVNSLLPVSNKVNPATGAVSPPAANTNVPPSKDQLSASKPRELTASTVLQLLLSSDKVQPSEDPPPPTSKVPLTASTVLQVLTSSARDHLKRRARWDEPQLPSLANKENYEESRKPRSTFQVGNSNVKTTLPTSTTVPSSPCLDLEAQADDDGAFSVLGESLPVMVKILKCLSLGEVLQCSLVNQSWLGATRLYLRGSTLSSVSLCLDKEPLRDQLLQFAECMKSCKQFPVSTLNIRMSSGPSHLCTNTIDGFEEAKHELSQLSNKVSVTRLSITDRLVSHSSGCQLLQLLYKLIETLPAEEVKHLEAGVHYLSQILKRFKTASVLGCKRRREIFLFPNLETFSSTSKHLDKPLRFEYGLEAFEAESLKEFYSPVHGCDLEELIQPEQIQALRICHLFDSNELKSLKHLAKNNPKLVSLTLFGVGAPEIPELFNARTSLEMISMLRNLTKSSCQTLVELRTNLPILNAMAQNCNSVLSRLKVLDLHYHPEEFEILGSIDFMRIFTNLLTVFIRAHYIHSTRFLVPEIFYDFKYLELIPSLTVRNLILQLSTADTAAEHELQPLHLQLLARAFPHTQNLSVHSLGEDKSKKLRMYSALHFLLGLALPQLKNLEVVTEYPLEDLEPVFFGVRMRKLIYWGKAGRLEKLKDLHFVPAFDSLHNFPKLELVKLTEASVQELRRWSPEVLRLDLGLSALVYALEYNSKELIQTRQGENPSFINVSQSKNWFMRRDYERDGMFYWRGIEEE